ncbi:hypothetical protein [Microbacterium azadirachtae]|uniref:Uncharacterized protein n=1 Tax=Microbacterium azadirachtae TaxID=582680 RepID=A0A0F0LHF8_9MICO|nr:hypothetical protein [Microbacterium azadirachtae]KJL32099.1 hypothetical protein RS86_02568 [Microbacterium azadirachtae]
MYMERSPKGRQIERLKGNADTISKRGAEITALGDAMGESASFLKSLHDKSSGQKGEAIEKLQEIVGDTHEQLKLAGELYRPTGPVLVSYATTLSEVQPRLNAAVKSCEELWTTFAGLPGYLPGDRPTWVVPPKEGSDEATENAQDDASKKQKHEEFVAEARIFDSEYDTWETAFDTAVDGIGNATSGKIKDGFWDDVDGFVAGALEVLKVVGLILTVAAIIIGGPIIAALAAIVAIATLALTLYQWSRDDAGLTDVIIAAIGVIPFGSMGKLFGGMKGLRGFADSALGGLLTGAGRAPIRQELTRVFGSGTAAFKFTGSFGAGARNFFGTLLQNHGADGRAVDSIARFFTGKGATALNNMSSAPDILISVGWNMYSRANTIVGNIPGSGGSINSAIVHAIAGDK